MNVKQKDIMIAYLIFGVWSNNSQNTKQADINKVDKRIDLDGRTWRPETVK